MVEDSEQITHYISLDDAFDSMDMLNIYALDPDFIENEAKYAKIKQEILGDDSSSDDSDDSDSDSDASEEAGDVVNDTQLQILDNTNTQTVVLRRAIYLTIMSSLNFEECAHKLMKLNIKDDDQMELCNMLIECCAQERSYVNFYGLIGERYAKFSTLWADHFCRYVKFCSYPNQLCRAFEETWKTVHRFETGRLRNIGKYFSHLLATDAVPWTVFALVTLTEQDTTSSSRIFLKILFTELNQVCRGCLCIRLWDYPHF